MKASLIVNPRSGPNNSIGKIEDVKKVFEKNGYETSVLITKKSGDAKAFAMECVKDKIDIAVAVGGDGTINEIVNGIVNSNTALGVIPTGTANVFANEIGVPRRKLFNSDFLLASAEKIIHGQERTIDLGKIELNEDEERYFTMWCGIGLDAYLTQAKSSAPPNFLGRVINYLSWIIKIIFITYRFSGTNNKIVIDNKEFNEKTSQILVCNGRLYANHFTVSKNAKLDDGKLDIIIQKDKGKLYLIKSIIKSLFTKNLESDFDKFQAKNISIKSEVPQLVHLDAEVVGKTPIKIKVVPNALKIRV